MKKFKNITIGGIQQKIFNLVLVTILLMMAAHTAVILYQAGELSNLARDTSDSQKQSIAVISGKTMQAVLDNNLTQSTQMEAYIAEDLFNDAVRVVKIVADYTDKLFADPEKFPVRAVSPPDSAKNGEISVQVLTEEGIDLMDPAVSEKLGLIGNLKELMMAVYADAHVDSCY